MKITAILPVSRTRFLERILESIQSQTKKPDNLIVIFDGSDEDFITVRNRVVEIENTLCVKSNNTGKAYSIPGRRKHIVNIHNQLRELLGDTDWIFSVEDDGILTNDALEKLVKVAKKPNVGMVTGVELGRWGVQYVGAWKVDDVANPKLMTSLENKTGQDLVEEIDACGLYCALINADAYKSHEFFTDNGLGPDVNLGLYLKRSGLRNYIHWNVPVTHITIEDDAEKYIPANSNSVVVKLAHLAGSTWHATR